MGPKSKGGRRTAALIVVFLLMLALAPVTAHAQAVDTEAGLEQAEEAKNQADGLVDAAVANRVEVEAELLDALEHYQNLSFELSAVSARLDRLGDLVALTGLAIDAARESADQKAVEAYMQALSIPGGVVWSSDSIEDAMVAGRTLAILAGEDEEAAASLEVTERDLIALDQQYQGELSNVQLLTSQVESEATRLQDLFAVADQEVALAIGAAVAADSAFRSALDEVEQARAAEDEQERQDERGTTTTTVPGVTGPAPTTTTAVGVTTTTVPVSTTVTTPGAISRPLKAAVEQWRSLVASYFSPNLVDQALSIIQCESLGDPGAYNPYSGASGLFQFIPGTWAVASVRAGYSGVSVFDPEANVASAAWLASYYQAAGRNPWTPWHCVP